MYVVVLLSETTTTEIYTYLHPLSLRDALPIGGRGSGTRERGQSGELGEPAVAVAFVAQPPVEHRRQRFDHPRSHTLGQAQPRLAADRQHIGGERFGALERIRGEVAQQPVGCLIGRQLARKALPCADRKRTRLNSSH